MVTQIAGCFFYNGKSQSKMDENWGYPYDLGNPYIEHQGTFSERAHLCGRNSKEVMWKTWSKQSLGLMEKHHPTIAMVFMGDSYLVVHPRNRKWIITPVISVNLAPT